MDLATDTVALARLLRRAHEVVLSGCGTPPVLRDVIVSSWQRCVTAGVDPDRPAPMMLGRDEVAERFAEHPLGAITPLVRRLLDSVTPEARHLVAISDADGTLLWADGHPRMLEATVAPHFMPGALCSESAVGTNAVGTALALDHPVQIFSAEHFNRLLHGWSCAAAPVHDPETGELLGTIDVSSSFRNAHPHTLALVTAVAQAAEAEVVRERAHREADLVERYIDRLPLAGRRPSALVASDGRVLAASPRGWLGRRIALDAPAALPDGTDAMLEHLPGGARIVWGGPRRKTRVPHRRLSIRALGADPPVLRLGATTLTVTERQLELLIVLAMTPAGLSAQALGRCLYGDGAKAVTVRAEVARARRVVGDVVGAHPYRLTTDVTADFLDVERLIAIHRLASAVDRYSGPLFPRSRAPAIVARRAALEARLAEAVSASGDVVLRRRVERRRRRAPACAQARRRNPVQPVPDPRLARLPLGS